MEFFSLYRDRVFVVWFEYLLIFNLVFLGRGKEEVCFILRKY